MLSAGATTVPSPALALTAAIAFTTTTALATATALATTAAAAAAAAASPTAVPIACLFRAPALQHRLSAQPNLAGRVDIDHHGREFIADVGDLLHSVDPIVCQLTDMHEAIHAGQQVDKSPIGFDPHNLTGVNLAYLDLFGQRFDFAASLFSGQSVQAGDKDRSVLFDIDS